MEKEIIIKLLKDASPEDAAKYIPAPYKLWLKQVKDAIGEIPFFISENKEGDVTGLCIFMTYRANTSLAYLLYVNVKEEYRGQGYGRTLLKKGCEYLKKSGYSSLEAIIPTQEQAQDIRFLLKEGFCETRKEIYLSYTLSALKESKITKSFDKLEPLIKKVKTLYEAPKEALANFKVLQKRKHRYIDITKLDFELTEVYIDKGQILGYMTFCLYESMIITQIDYYISGDKEAKYAYPAILGEAIERILSEDSDDFLMCLYVADILQYEALKELLGNPNEENTANIYTLKL